HRHARHERVQAGFRGHGTTLVLVEGRRVREERRRMAVGSDSQQRERESDAGKGGVVLGGGRLGVDLPADAVHGLRRPRQAGEEGLADHPVVRAPVVRRDAAFVDPPQLDAAPVGAEDCNALVRRTRARAAGEADMTYGVDGLCDQLGRRLGRELRIVDDPKLDVVHPPSSASSFDRSIAAWIAFRNAARTPARSSSRIARIVVPPGDVTASRSSTGCTRSSRSSFAVPSTAWTTSWVEISRERPRRMPASIIASARRAKYAGPDPDTAVTASMYRSGTRTTPPKWDRHSSASARCSSPAWAPAQMPAIPSCTTAGAFGIERTTGTDASMRCSIALVGTAAATERTVWLGASAGPTSPSSTSKSCGFTAITTSPAPSAALLFERVASIAKRSRSS